MMSYFVSGHCYKYVVNSHCMSGHCVSGHCTSVDHLSGHSTIGYNKKYFYITKYIQEILANKFQFSGDFRKTEKNSL